MSDSNTSLPSLNLHANTTKIEVSTSIGMCGGTRLFALPLFCRWILNQDPSQDEDYDGGDPSPYVYVMLYTEEECQQTKDFELPPHRSLLKEEWVYGLSNGPCYVYFLREKEEWGSCKFAPEMKEILPHLVFLAVTGETYELNQKLQNLQVTNGIQVLTSHVNVP